MLQQKVILELAASREFGLSCLAVH